MITKENISHLEDMIGQVSSMIDWVNSNTQSSKRLALVKELVNSRRRLKRIFAPLFCGLIIIGRLGRLLTYIYIYG